MAKAEEERARGAAGTRPGAAGGRTVASFPILSPISLDKGERGKKKVASWKRAEGPSVSSRGSMRRVFFFLVSAALAVLVLLAATAAPAEAKRAPLQAAAGKRFGFLSRGKDVELSRRLADGFLAYARERKRGRRDGEDESWRRKKKWGGKKKGGWKGKKGGWKGADGDGDEVVAFQGGDEVKVGKRMRWCELADNCPDDTDGTAAASGRVRPKVKPTPSRYLHRMKMRNKARRAAALKEQQQQQQLSEQNKAEVSAGRRALAGIFDNLKDKITSLWDDFMSSSLVQGVQEKINSIVAYAGSLDVNFFLGKVTDAIDGISESLSVDFDVGDLVDSLLDGLNNVSHSPTFMAYMKDIEELGDFGLQQLEDVINGTVAKLDDWKDDLVEDLGLDDLEDVAREVISKYVPGPGPSNSSLSLSLSALSLSRLSFSLFSYYRDAFSGEREK